MNILHKSPKLDRVSKLNLAFLIGVILVSLSIPAIASEERLNATDEPEQLQTEITQRDLNIIEQLVIIAQRNSPQVLETKAAMGLSGFQDIMAVEFSPSLTKTNSISPESYEENEHSFSFSFTIDPIKLLSIFQQRPIARARWNEAKHQKRLAVIQHYFAYLQARQAAKIASYRIQKFTRSDRIASLNSQAISPRNTNNLLANPNYVAAATEMLNTNARERVALEELAACVGLSASATMTVINGH
jgi:hypothetical protein